MVISIALTASAERTVTGMAEYIDKADAIAVIQENYAQAAMVGAFDGAARLVVVRGEIGVLPAADVRENVKLEWIRTPTAWVYCSVCGEEPPQETNARTRFCPNCGAKMDGEDGDGDGE